MSEFFILFSYESALSLQIYMTIKWIRFTSSYFPSLQYQYLIITSLLLQLVLDISCFHV